jgi:redox-sensitive bicupin YhaK (pirin superfamily)
LVSDSQDSATTTPIKINQDANIHVTEVFPGSTVDFQLREGRQAYLLCVEGSATFTGTHGSELLEQHDAAELFGPNVITVTPGDKAAHLLLVEMAYTGVGRTDL